MHLTGAHTRGVDNQQSFCEEVVHGTLFGSPIMLITTGIGNDRAGLCLRSLLSVYHATTKEILFLGTGGFSPARGGIVNSDDCDTPASAAKADLVTLGSVCVSPLTTNWDCHKCVWPEKVDSACMDSGCSLHDRADLFGDWGCSYYSTCSLADEVIEASAGGADLNAPPPLLFELQARYWSAMSNGTGQDYLGALGDMRPKVFDYSACAEATSSTFWVGTPYEELARTYVAGVINDAFSSKLFNESEPAKFAEQASKGLTKRDVVAVSAMEGAGWMEVLALEEVFLRYSRIKAVNIRGAADYVTPPLQRRQDGTWEELSSFSEDLKGDALTVQGYDFAMQTTSALVLNLFRARSATAAAATAALV